jgi:hypothetical protein
MISCVVALGFWRDHLFVNVNFQISRLYYHDTFDYVLPPDMKWLEQFSYSQLYYGKFLLTFIFVLLYFIPTVLIVNRFFPGKKFIRWTVWIHIFIFSFSLLVFMIGYFGIKYQAMYAISRYIMGFMQSPLLLMILVSAFKIAAIKPSSGQA